jgi:hypothetical protein
MISCLALVVTAAAPVPGTCTTGWIVVNSQYKVCAPISGSACGDTTDPIGKQVCYGTGFTTCTTSGWSEVQSCATGTKCSQQGNSAQCVAPPPPKPPASSSNCPTSTNPVGKMVCTSSTSFKTCTTSGWSVIQSCGPGTKCSQQGNYILCGW